MVGVVSEKEEVDPITMLLYNIHCGLSFKEVRTLTALANVPASLRADIQDGLDLFSYLNDEDKIHKDYLEMLLNSIRRQDLAEHVQRFYIQEWKFSAFAYTMETIRQTGEIPVVPRSNFKTVEISEKHTYDVYLHYADSDKAVAEQLIQRFAEAGVSMLSGDFTAVWTEEPLKCRYCVPIISKTYIQLALFKELQLLLDQEINPGASLKNIIPVLNGVTPEYVAQFCSPLKPVAQFSYLAGIGESTTQACNIIHKGLKTSVNRWYKPPVVLQCTSKHQSGKTQVFDVRLGTSDSFVVCRSDTSVLFRGDKGIKGLREAHQDGHCLINTQPGFGSDTCVSVTGMGHPLTFVSVIAPIFIPHGVSTLLLGREWISIAAKRNAQQCQTKIRISYLEGSERITLKVVNPTVREEITFTSCVVIGSGEGSNLKILVPGVDINKQHCKLSRTEEGGWLLKPLAPTAYVFLQLPKEKSEPVCVPSGGEILVGTCTTIKVLVNDEVPEDEGIGLSETCSRISGKTA